MRVFDFRKRADANDKALDEVLIEQSSELFEAAQRGGGSERRALAEWLSQSKRHVRTHLFISALDEELRNIDPQRQIPIPDVRGNADLPNRLPRAWRALPHSSSGIKWVAVAAVLLATVAAATLHGPAADYFNGWREYRTAVGEQRSLSLSDGSVVQLNTDTRIKARLSGESRDIRLLDGEALFKVAPDKARPFRVRTSNAYIVAVGTQFNVYQIDGETKVAVLEGRVRISARENTSTALTMPIVAAGHEVDVRSDGQAVQRAAPDVVNRAAWVQRRVVFKQEPLKNVIAQFNRYRQAPQLRVEGSALADRRYSGTFDVDDPASLEAVLSNENDVVLERSGDEILIRGR